MHTTNKRFVVMEKITGLVITIVFISPIHSLPNKIYTLPSNQSDLSTILTNDCVQDIACASDTLREKLPYIKSLNPAHL